MPPRQPDHGLENDRRAPSRVELGVDGVKPSVEAARQPSGSAHADVTLRRTADMVEAQKTFRRLKAYKQMPLLKVALQASRSNTAGNRHVEPTGRAA